VVHVQESKTKRIEEVIHILAHSISEYVTKILNSKTGDNCIDTGIYINFRIKMYLHNLAYRLMDTLSDYPFVCCKAMLKAEAGLVREALEVINRDVDLSLVTDKDERNGFEAELAFFRWYFSQLFNIPHMEREKGEKTPQAIFTNYAENVDDSDAKMHLTLL